MGRSLPPSKKKKLPIPDHETASNVESPPDPTGPNPTPPTNLPGPIFEPIGLLGEESEFDKLAGEWNTWVATLPPELSTKLVHIRPTSLPEPGLLVMEPASNYNWVVDALERADVRGKVESSLKSWLNRPMSFRLLKPIEAPGLSRPGHREAVIRGEGLEDDPIVKLLVERFEARLVRVDVNEDPSPGGE